MTAPGSTYSPGSWYALVSPSCAVFVDPSLPGAQLDALWDGVLAGRGADELLAVITAGGRARLPAFALAAVEGNRVRVVVRGAVQITLQDADGLERGVTGAGVEPWREDVVERADALWFVRPGGGRDGLALPVVCAAVTADILAWQPDGAARRPGVKDTGGRRIGVPDFAVPSGQQPAPASSPAPEGPGAGFPPAVPAPTPVPVPASPGFGHPGPPDPSPFPVSLDPQPAAAYQPEASYRPEPMAAYRPEPVGGYPADPVPPVADTRLAPVPTSRRDGRRQAGPDDTTVPAAARSGLLHFSTGEVVDVDGPVIIGRAPAAPAGEHVRLVPVKGSGRGISRTHVRVDIDEHGPFAVDLGSRNGTVVRATTGESIALEPGVPYRLHEGQIVAMADVSFEFRTL